MLKKEHLPQKDCTYCKRPFSWRKKWERVWEEVKFCSERCRRESKKGGGLQHSDRLGGGE